MILESALLDVKPGEEVAFETAINEARPLMHPCLAQLSQPSSFIE